MRKSYFDFTNDLFFFHICTKMIRVFIQLLKNRSLVESKYVLRLFFFAVNFSTLIDLSRSQLVTGIVADMTRIT